MATRQTIVLWIYSRDKYGDYVVGKHVVKYGWNAVSTCDLIRKEWGGLWVGEDCNTFLPWHSISKIGQEIVEEEISDGKEEGSIHSDGPSP